MGMALGYISRHPEWAPHWRLFVMTGFLGGLTTFSTFSGESLILIHEGKFGWALGHIATNLFGSIALCALGYAVIRGPA